MGELNPLVTADEEKIGANGTSMLFDLNKARQKYDYDDKKAYIEGIKYYYGIMNSERAIRVDRGYYPVLKEFGEKLRNFEKYENSEDLKAMSDLLKNFFPDGNVSMLFVSVGVTFALDGISEYMMHLKKLFLVRE